MQAHVATLWSKEGLDHTRQISKDHSFNHCRIVGDGRVVIEHSGLFGQPAGPLHIVFHRKRPTSLERGLGFRHARRVNLATTHFVQVRLR